MDSERALVHKTSFTTLLKRGIASIHKPHKYQEEISHISIDSAMQEDDATKFLLAVDFSSRMIES